MGMIVCLLAILFSGYVFASGNVIKLGVNTGGQLFIITPSGTTNFGVTSTLALSYDYSFLISDNITAGAGLEYPTTIQDTDGSKYTFFPVYGLITTQIPSSDNITPYLTVRVGFNTFSGPSDLIPGYSGLVTASYGGGLYYGLGGGIVFAKNFRVETLYSVSNGKIIATEHIYGSSTDNTVKFSKISLFVGYSF